MPNQNRSTLLFVGFVVAMGVAACSGSNNRLCAPNLVTACDCGGGLIGQQVCNADGSGFGACQGCVAPRDGGVPSDLVKGDLVGSDLVGSDLQSHDLGAVDQARNDLGARDVASLDQAPFDLGSDGAPFDAGGGDGAVNDLGSSDGGGLDLNLGDGGTVCGGFAGTGCPMGQFCDFPPAAICGAADGTGTCADIPFACSAIADPACGCDGMTYGNPCDANKVGVSVAHAGHC